jgi:MFS family permease
LASREAGGDGRPVTSAATPLHQLRPPRRPAWAGRNYGLLTAAAFAVLEAGGDGGDVGLVAASRTLPLVLFLLIGGAVADRLPRHRVMVAANALNCLSQAVLAVLVLTRKPRLWQLMLLTALGGAA